MPLSTTWRVLEYGCGTAMLARLLVDELRSITVVDSSEGMLDQVRQQMAITGERRLIPLRLDLQIDPIPTERFDAVLSMLALHHVRDVPRVLTALATVLRPGGWLAIADLDADGGLFHAEHRNFDGHDGFQREHLAGQLETAGFLDPVFSTCTVLEKQVDGRAHAFPVFLAVARTPDPASAR